MQLKECYDKFGGNYEAVLQRIPKDEIIMRFLVKFLTEPTYKTLSDALAQDNYEEAFRGAHSLKGICQNLGFDRLEVSSSRLTEYFRGWSDKTIVKSEWEELFAQVQKDYEEVIAAIQEMVQQNG